MRHGDAGEIRETKAGKWLGDSGYQEQEKKNCQAGKKLQNVQKDMEL